MLVLKTGLVYFFLVFGLGFLLGAIRIPFIVPRIGVRKAELLEMPIMLLGIVLAAKFILSQFKLPPAPLAYLSVGIIALSLTLIAEWQLVVCLQKTTFKQYLKSRDPVSGSVYILLLVLFALMPFVLHQIDH